MLYRCHRQDSNAKSERIGGRWLSAPSTSNENFKIAGQCACMHDGMQHGLHAFQEKGIFSSDGLTVSTGHQKLLTDSTPYTRTHSDQPGAHS